MNDPHSRPPRPSSPTDGQSSPKKHSFLERFSSLLLREPEDRAQLLEVLHHAHERELVDADALSMMEGVLRVGELCARDIMVQRAQMDMIDVDATPEQIIPFVIRTAHSRFPVYDGARDNVIGILLAKDLLRYYQQDSFALRAMLRPAIFIPESKRLNVLLREFRSNRNHLALVIDEYGGIAGLLTIEDVLEQIVGEIEDEHDDDDAPDMIVEAEPLHWRVRALTDIDAFNEFFGTTFSSEHFDTIGGLVTDAFGHVPQRGETVEIGPLRFEVMRANARKPHLFMVHRVIDAAQPEADATQA